MKRVRPDHDRKEKAMSVRNILSDGTVRESMEGIEIPPESEFYAVLAAIMRNREVAA